MWCALKVNSITFVVPDYPGDSFCFCKIVPFKKNVKKFYFMLQGIYKKPLSMQRGIARDFLLKNSRC
jgi:hypothetical protein